MGNQAHFLFGSRDSPYTGGPTLSPPQEREFLFAPAQLVPSTHHSHGPTIMGARPQACPPSVTMRGEGREGVIPAALGPRRKMFPDPREAGRTTPLCSHSSGAQGPAPKGQQARNPPAGGLTFPGDANAVQPGLLEAQMGVSALRKPRPGPPQEKASDTCPGPGQGLSGVDCN